MQKNKMPIFVGFIVLLCLLLRLPWLSLVPEVEADEGIWTVSAKHYIAHGDWWMSQFVGHAMKSTVFQVAVLFLFKVLGPGIWAARLVSVGAGVISAVLLYKLVVCLTKDRLLGITAMVLFGTNHFAILLSRKAMLEPSQLMYVLLAAVLLTIRRWWATVLAGVAFSFAILVKVNSVHLIALFGLFILFSREGEKDRISARFGRALLFGVAVILVAGSVNGALYLWNPDEFISTYRFELEAKWLFPEVEPIFRAGRFGFAPAHSAQVAIDLYREYPFLLVLATMGIVVGVLARAKGSLLFFFWMLVSVGFYFAQLFSPPRYTYLFLPALAYFAALAMRWMVPDEADKTRRRVYLGMLIVYVLFNAAYVTASGLNNRERKLPDIISWVQENAELNDSFMGSAYHCVDLPNPTYYYWTLAMRDPQRLADSVDQLEIDYMIKDADWSEYLWKPLTNRLELVHEFYQGGIYRVLPRVEDDGPVDRD